MTQDNSDSKGAGRELLPDQLPIDIGESDHPLAHARDLNLEIHLTASYLTSDGGAQSGETNLERPLSVNQGPATIGSVRDISDGTANTLYDGPGDDLSSTPSTLLGDRDGLGAVEGMDMSDVADLRQIIGDSNRGGEVADAYAKFENIEGDFQDTDAAEFFDV